MQDDGMVGRVPQEVVVQDLRAMLRGAVRVGLEACLEAELETVIGADWYERAGGRRDHRNGHYPRQLLTSFGQVAVAMPRGRRWARPSQVVGRYQRRMPEVDGLLTSAYVHGVSTRKVGALTTALLGTRVSRSTVSRVTQRLEPTVEGLRRAPIVGPHPYLFLDATFVDVRWARRVENISALVAYAVGPDGYRHLLGVTLGVEESEASWSDLLRQLTERGLTGVQLVIADEHAGLAAAVRHWVPEARRQRCVVHLQRNVLTQVPRRLRPRLAREVGAVFRAPSLAEAKGRLARFRTRWRGELPEAVACLESGFAAATVFFGFPPAHWHRLRTTNSIERLHREIKRRTRVVGAFPDRASTLRLITAVAIAATAIWGDRQYLDVTTLNAVASAA